MCSANARGASFAAVEDLDDTLAVLMRDDRGRLAAAAVMGPHRARAAVASGPRRRPQTTGTVSERASDLVAAGALLARNLGVPPCIAQPPHGRSLMTLNIPLGEYWPFGVSTNPCFRRGKRSRALVETVELRDRSTTATARNSSGGPSRRAHAPAPTSRDASRSASCEIWPRNRARSGRRQTRRDTSRDPNPFTRPDTAIQASTQSGPRRCSPLTPSASGTAAFVRCNGAAQSPLPHEPRPATASTRRCDRQASQREPDDQFDAAARYLTVSVAWKAERSLLDSNAADANVEMDAVRHDASLWAGIGGDCETL